MKGDGVRRWYLGFTPERRWTDWERLECDPVLLDRLGRTGAALVVGGVRELLTNVERHGCPGNRDAELFMDPETDSLDLVIPGNEFDSVARASTAVRGFLGRFHAMLTDDGVTWTHRFEDDANHLVFSLADAKFCVEPEENGDA
jgi:hypothetical protein